MTATLADLLPDAHLTPMPGTRPGESLTVVCLLDVDAPTEHDGTPVPVQVWLEQAVTPDGPAQTRAILTAGAVHAVSTVMGVDQLERLAVAAITAARALRHGEDNT